MSKKRARASEYSFAASCVSAFRALLGTELLFLSMLSLLASEFTKWKIPVKSLVPMQMILILVILLYEVAACKKYRVLFYALIELVYLAVGVFFFLKKFTVLESSYQALYTDYIAYWNRQFHTNYPGYAPLEYELTFALAFTVLAVFLFCVILRYVTGLRLFLLVPGFFALSLGLLVTVRPNWNGLALFFVGTLVVYSGPWETSKRVIRERGKKKGVGTRQFVPFVITVFLGTGIALFSATAFAGLAEHIPEKTPVFLEFQVSLEEKAKSLKNLGLAFSQKKETVNNSTPEYNDQEILEIRVSSKPLTNLYLQDFYSGTYSQGQWKSEGKYFSEEAEKAGFDPDHVSTLLHQELYENQQTLVGNGDIADESCDYTITYKVGGMRSALVPYFSDLSDSGSKVWVGEEGIAQKKRSLDILSFRGLKRNLNINQGYGWAIDTGNDALNWYSEYVMEHYRTGSDQLPALEKYAKELESDLANNLDVYLYSGSDETYITNMLRLEMAEAVRKKLQEEAEYNLYLDEIPEGTDTIQYFLESGHEGYCMHFASAGTLLLQELGVPARYASGYVVKSFAFSKDGEDYTATVLDRNGHAWAEIYLEGIGWVPCEMTPGYGNSSSNLPTEEESQENPEKSTQTNTMESQIQEMEIEDTQKETETQTASTEETQRGSGQGKTVSSSTADKENAKPIVWIAVGILAALLVLFLVAVMVVKGMRSYREALTSEIHRRQYRRAVRRINRRIYRRLWNHAPEVLHLPRRKTRGFGVEFASMTDEEFLKKLIQNYPAVNRDDWKRYFEIVQKAVFSEEEISLDEMQFCYHIYSAYRKK